MLRLGSEMSLTRRERAPLLPHAESSSGAKTDFLLRSRAVLFLDTDALPARERRDQSLIDNAAEAALVKEVSVLINHTTQFRLTDGLAQVVAGLMSAKVAENDVAVITPYRQQVKLITNGLSGAGGIEVLTADRSQGRDKECIIISLVRSNATRNVSTAVRIRSHYLAGALLIVSRSRQAGDLLKDRRRINVCLTRAKSKLVIIGSRSTVASAPVMKELLDIIQDRGWIYDLPATALTCPVPPPPTLDTPKAARRGGGALALRRALAVDILNQV